MKICFVTKSDYNVIKDIGRIRELPKELKKLENEVALISALYSDDKSAAAGINSFSDVHLISIGRNSILMSVLYFIRLNIFFIRSKKILSLYDFFILDFNSVIPLLPFMLLSRIGIIKPGFILDVRTVPVEVKGLKKFLSYAEYDTAIKIAGILCKGITAITGEISKDIRKRGFGIKKKIGIWSSGVSTETFYPDAMPARLNGFVNSEDFVLMHHGVLSNNRGLEELIMAFQLIADISRKIKLIISGSGQAYGYLKELVSGSKLEDRVLLTGHIPYKDIPGYIALCNAGIIPLPDINWWRVSSPQKVFEYLAMGKNLIVSDILAHRSILGENGFTAYFKEVTPQNIAVCILKCADRWSGIKFNNEAYEQAEKNYTWKSQAVKLNNFLIEI